MVRADVFRACDRRRARRSPSRRTTSHIWMLWVAAALPGCCRGVLRQRLAGDGSVDRADRGAREGQRTPVRCPRSRPTASSARRSAACCSSPRCGCRSGSTQRASRSPQRWSSRFAAAHRAPVQPEARRRSARRHRRRPALAVGQHGPAWPGAGRQSVGARHADDRGDLRAVRPRPAAPQRPVVRRADRDRRSRRRRRRAGRRTVDQEVRHSWRSSTATVVVWTLCMFAEGFWPRLWVSASRRSRWRSARRCGTRVTVSLRQRIVPPQLFGRVNSVIAGWSGDRSPSAPRWAASSPSVRLARPVLLRAGSAWSRAHAVHLDLCAPDAGCRRQPADRRPSVRSTTLRSRDGDGSLLVSRRLALATRSHPASADARAGGQLHHAPRTYVLLISARYLNS